MNAMPTAVTDPDLFWLPMSSCPTGPKVMLLNKGGIANVGWYDGKDPWWVGWHPLPKIPKEIKALIEPTYKPSNIGNLIGD
jgi:hypothetical protein